ncbi:MAG TPA: DUF5691 domain-containing protein [Gemmatimonadaceae bacterium]|nr:DUF5691 domain-containing protein [Gemmatimonadaceae bacterium]
MTTSRADLSVWPAVVNAALLGTDRTGLALPPAEGSLGAACSALLQSEADPAAALLRVAAAANAYRRSGWSPGRTEVPPPEPCPPDARPVCKPGAAALLRRIIHGEHESLLGAWLTLAMRHQVRAPADALRELLDVGKREPALRALVLAAGGTRATWLAGFSDDWSYAIAGDGVDSLVTTFETGTGAARLAAFQQLRRLDAERARVELEKTWTQESPAERAAFTVALSAGLGPADEPLLERALDDRRKEVRQAAASLLARLPTSALVARMVDRATSLLSLGKTGVLKRTRIEVAPPSEADAALVRDGVDPKPPQGLGERAWWLSQIIGVVPPSTWTSRWSLDPAAILKATGGNEWSDALVAGWLTATERHRDASWAAAFWQYADAARVDARWAAPAPERVFTTVVAAEKVDGELRRMVDAERNSLRGDSSALVALLQWQHEWSDSLARAVARRLKQYVADAKAPLTVEFGLRALIERCAHAVPVSAIGAFIEGWPEGSGAWESWAPAVDSLSSVLRFRSDLDAAFTT